MKDAAIPQNKVVGLRETSQSSENNPHQFGRFLCQVWKAEFFCPGWFVLRALIVTMLYYISELFGLREYTTFLSGTTANVGVSPQMASFLGLIHLLLYVGFILLVPIFLITAGFIIAWRAVQRAKRRASMR